MSSEPPFTELGKRKRIYHRRPFDSSRHCGHPVDRNPESLMKRIVGYEARIAELNVIKEANGRLSPQEGAKIKRYSFLLVATKATLDKLQRFGPDDRGCMRAKGYKTSHPGVNYCSAHCECKGRDNYHVSAKHQYGSRARAPKLREIMDRMEAAGHDLLDLEPELLLVKAKLELFVNEKDDFDPETVRSFGIIVEQIRKMVETLNDKKFKAMISMEMYNLILFRMSEVLMKHVTDPEVLDKIVDGWSKISVETAGKKNAQIIGELSGG